jgi:hypothetical protein
MFCSILLRGVSASGQVLRDQNMTRPQKALENVSGAQSNNDELKGYIFYIRASVAETPEKSSWCPRNNLERKTIRACSSDINRSTRDA